MSGEPLVEISDNARTIWKSLPADGSTTGAIRLKERINMSSADFRVAKNELKQAGLVVLGRGRGGSLGRAEGSELPPEPVKPDPKERMAKAREAKEAKTRTEREQAAIREHVIEVGRRHFPNAVDIRPGLYEDRYYIEVYNEKEKGAKVYFLPHEAML